jgi:hypothetical protein
VLQRVVRTLAVAIWFGGLTTLGTNVAPLIFRNVPAPTSADAMTLVFMRFDRFAIASGLMLLAVEIAWAASALASRAGVASRLLLVVTALGVRLVEALWLAPAIAELHRKGAVRGLGDLGLSLERLHRGAEATGKLEAGLLLVFVVVVAWGEARAAQSTSGGAAPV